MPWQVLNEEPERRPSDDPDCDDLFVYLVTDGREQRTVGVAISTMALAANPTELPEPLDVIVLSRGLYAVASCISRGFVPTRITASTYGIETGETDELKWLNRSFEALAHRGHPRSPIRCLTAEYGQRVDATGWTTAHPTTVPQTVVHSS